MDLGLRGKGAVVTGASRGIGRAIALRLVEEGAGVAICARSEPALREAEVELRSQSAPVYAAVCDVGNADALDNFLDAARAKLGRVDILVNNPSGFVFADDQDAWDSTLNVDLMAAVRASWKVAPWMGGAGGGVIIHISSIAGLEAAASRRPTRRPKRPWSVTQNRSPCRLPRRESESTRWHRGPSSSPAGSGSK